MKILMVHSNFSIQTINRQPWRYTYELSHSLSKLGHEVVILTDVDRNKMNNHVAVVATQPELLRSRLRHILSSFQDVDAVLYFGNPLSGIYLNDRTLRELKVPLVLYISSFFYSIAELRRLSFRELKAHWIHLIFCLPLLSRVVRLLNAQTISAIVSPSDLLKKRLMTYGVGREKILTFPIAFDAESCISGIIEDLFAIKERLGLSSEDFVVTYLGSPSTSRGTDTLVKAAWELRRSALFKRIKVLILSRIDSPLEKKEESILHCLVNKYKLSNNVNIISGVLSHQRVKEYIWASDIIALPFKLVPSEPPLSVLESMALGRPVITTNTCGLPELVTPDRGLVVEPDNPKDLALAICELAQDSKRKVEMGQKARDFALKLPRWNYLAKLYEHLLENLSYKN